MVPKEALTLLTDTAKLAPVNFYEHMNVQQNAVGSIKQALARLEEYDKKAVEAKQRSTSSKPKIIGDNVSEDHNEAIEEGVKKQE